jgi:hypothetical protein
VGDQVVETRLFVQPAVTGKIDDRRRFRIAFGAGRQPRQPVEDALPAGAVVVEQADLRCRVGADRLIGEDGADGPSILDRGGQRPFAVLSPPTP